jgi:hypothetical protein
MTTYSTYPYKWQNYQTLTMPSTITHECIEPNCPGNPFPYNKYNDSYTKDQIVKAETGLNRILSNTQISWLDNLEGCPIYNSNRNMNSIINYMNYSRSII